jgi:hypothetical protein
MSRTDVHAPITLAHLLHAEVVDESGRRLGRVHDVRVIRDADPAEADQAPGYRVEGLIIGRRGLRVRLGLRTARSPEPLRASEPLPWEEVIAFERGRLIVKAAEGT